MSRRFHSLKRALRALRPPGAGPETVVPDAPEGSILRKFQDYKAGKVVVEYTRSDASHPGNETFCSLTPFGLLGAEVRLYLTNISARSLAAMTPAGVSSAILGIDATPAGNVGLEKEKGFKPAKVIVSLVPGGIGTSTPSKITGDKYKKKATVTYTFPFGSTATHVSYKAAKTNLIATISTGTANRGVTFKAEAL